MEQVREADPRYQIGAGKVKELAELVKKTGAEKLIFDNQLKSVQSYNLAKATSVEAIDRFQLILEIFTKRATTTEAKLQIQLAKLGYELAHAKERVRLAKKGEQPGFMGLGAYEVDVYFEAVKKQVHTLRKKLKVIRSERLLHRERRAELDFSSISLAGYTNAGKSSLFNALTEANVPVDNALFTTLSTTTRLVEIAKRKFLLTDTVGFIDRLPLTLIEAFRSTLEETIYANLILLVIDASEPFDVVEKKTRICLETIERIGALGIPLITVLNKIDLLTEADITQRFADFKDKAPQPVAVSALRKTNIEQLKKEILKVLENYVKASFTIPLSDEAMRFLSWMHSRAEVHETKYVGNSANVTFEAVPWFVDKVRKRVENEFHGEFKRIPQPTI
jgi:GTP-binding protein HflX